MSTNVVMPQMGESIAEGTIVRWIKKVGDAIDRDEPLFEISTDKVDAEIPSPAAGVLTEIKVKEGETVPVNSVVATIGPPAKRAPRPVRPRGSSADHDAGSGRRPAGDVAAAGVHAAAGAAPAQPARRTTGCQTSPGRPPAAEVVAARAAHRRASTTSTSRRSRAPASAAA